VQEFRRVAKESSYEKRLLVKKFKRGMNRIIRRKLIETKRPSRSIEQWYERTTNLDSVRHTSHWRWKSAKWTQRCMDL